MLLDAPALATVSAFSDPIHHPNSARVRTRSILLDVKEVCISSLRLLSVYFLSLQVPAA